LTEILDKAFLIQIFLPLVAGFVLLFSPSKTKAFSKTLTLVISIITLALAICIFIVNPPDFIWSVLQIGGCKLELLLTANPLNSFILKFFYFGGGF